MTTEARNPFDGVRQVLFLHAHPDDETLATGGTIAMLTSKGVGVTVLTGTRGERGEVVEGPLKTFEGTRQLADLRMTELAGAMSALGVSDQRFLGSPSARTAGMDERRYADSGMVWLTPTVAAAASDSTVDALSRAPLGEVVSDIRAVIDSTRPDMIVTYDDQGGYGHPDHVRMHDAGVRAAQATGTRITLIEPDDAALIVPDEGTPRLAVFSLDVEPWLPAKVAALSSHRSQLTMLNGSYRLSGGQVHLLSRVESYVES
ncbi:MAG TPA: PIG-L family deacetylase [Nitrolancea sp.]|jgi:N-acetyl-1-D-myo-inositol-2-amino-2-deoxy-alpha-D-glucopyranoside deacetylase|nr:PIG-L family deacetylase [Nitrolancea sp.]